MCGFSDVRKREDGMYYCPICGRELGKDFDLTIALYCGKREAEELQRRCSPKHPTGDKDA